MNDSGLKEFVPDNCDSALSSPLALSTSESSQSLNEIDDRSDISDMSDYIQQDDSWKEENLEPVTDSTAFLIESDSEVDIYSEKSSELDSTSQQISALLCSPTKAATYDEKVTVWWIVLFTCMFQTVHKVPGRAIEWLLQFLKVLLLFLGKVSEPIARMAQLLPQSNYLREEFLRHKVNKPDCKNYVACRKCHSIYDFKSLEQSNSIVSCSLCNVPLLKKVITTKNSIKLYPHLMFPTCSLISSLQIMLNRPNFANLCNQWRSHSSNSDLLFDVYDGQMWKTFKDDSGRQFFNQKNTVGLMLNVDWFQPYVRKIYSVGVIYLTILNIPRRQRYKRENIILIGLIPGPSEPPLTINSYLDPLVQELIQLWRGVVFIVSQERRESYRCALISVACDLPATKKVCRFLSHSANLGCSKCLKSFATGLFGKMNYSGFNRSLWELRSNSQHRASVNAILKAKTNSDRKEQESTFGCRKSILLDLPYFDAVAMHILDPMHNLYLGTAKYVFHSIWMNGKYLDNSSLATINTRVHSVNIPSHIKLAKLPDCIENSKTFTAEQWMTWVNYYSLICIHDLIPNEHLECWRHFVLASRLLCKRPIAVDEIKVADALFLQFGRRFQALYGEQLVTPNIHMHCHLASSVFDYGPISSFWLFPFERYNGLLGEQPTNNHTVEPQILKRFLDENAYSELLHNYPQSTVTDVFKPVIYDHATSLLSVRNSDDPQYNDTTTSGIKFTAANKYSIDTFDDTDFELLEKLYKQLYPFLKEPLENKTLVLPSCFKKMTSLSLNDFKFSSDDYILASTACSSNQPTTLFSNPSFRPAQILYFAIHSFQTNNGHYITHAFVVVKWPQPHPCHNNIGKPVEVWTSSVYEVSLEHIVPIETIKAFLITAEYKINEENVLITVPHL